MILSEAVQYNNLVAVVMRCVADLLDCYNLCLSTSIMECLTTASTSVMRPCLLSDSFPFICRFGNYHVLRPYQSNSGGWALSLIVCLYVCLSVCGWGFISVRLSVGGALSLSVCLYVCPSVCGWGFISVCLSLCKQLHLTMFVSNLVQYHYSDVRKLFYYSLDNPGELVPRYVFSMFRVHIKMCSYLKISEIK